MSLDANCPQPEWACLALAPITLVRAGECVARGSVELRPIQGRGARSSSKAAYPLSLQSVTDYGPSSPRRDIETRLNMTDTDKIVAATFAVARCGGLGHSKPEDYIAEYDILPSVAE